MGKAKDNLAANGIQESFFSNIDLDEVELRQQRDRKIKEILSQLKHIYSILYKFNASQESKDKMKPKFLKLMQELNNLGIDAKEEVKKIVKKIEGRSK